MAEIKSLVLVLLLKYYYVYNDHAARNLICIVQYSSSNEI